MMIQFVKSIEIETYHDFKKQFNSLDDNFNFKYGNDKFEIHPDLYSVLSWAEFILKQNASKLMNRRNSEEYRYVSHSTKTSFSKTSTAESKTIDLRLSFADDGNDGNDGNDTDNVDGNTTDTSTPAFAAEYKDAGNTFSNGMIESTDLMIENDSLLLRGYSNYNTNRRQRRKKYGKYYNNNNNKRRKLSFSRKTSNTSNGKYERNPLYTIYKPLPDTVKLLFRGLYYYRLKQLSLYCNFDDFIPIGLLHDILQEIIYFELGLYDLKLYFLNGIFCDIANNSNVLTSQWSVSLNNKRDKNSENCNCLKCCHSKPRPHRDDKCFKNKFLSKLGYCFGMYEGFAMFIVLLFHSDAKSNANNIRTTSHPHGMTFVKNKYNLINAGWHWFLLKIDYYFDTQLSKNSSLNLFRICIIIWVFVLFWHIVGGFYLWFRARSKRNLLLRLKTELKINVQKNDSSLPLSQRICHRQKVQMINGHGYNPYDQYRIFSINKNDNNDYNESHAIYEKNHRNDSGRIKESNEIFGICTRLHDTANDLHAGELLIVLQRWLNLSYLRINDELYQVKYLLLCLQKYILPFSIAICVLLDPNSAANNYNNNNDNNNNNNDDSNNHNTGDNDQWYAYASILIYYLHLHLLYEIFHQGRHFLKALARVTLFWGILMSVIAAIITSTQESNKKNKWDDDDSHSSKNDNGNNAGQIAAWGTVAYVSQDDASDSTQKSENINFYESLAGLLIFGTFVVTFDLCWMFYLRNRKTKLRLIFFVILVNCCYLGTFLYLLENDLIWIKHKPVVYYNGFCSYLDTPTTSSSSSNGNETSHHNVVLMDVTCYVYICVIVLFLIALLHCQIVFNQVIDIVIYGSVDDYLTSPIMELDHDYFDENYDHYSHRSSEDSNMSRNASHRKCCRCCRRNHCCQVLLYMGHVYWQSLFSSTKVDKIYGF